MKNLILSSIMLGTENPKSLIEFYTKALGAPDPDMSGDSFASWQVGDTSFNVMEHSEVKGKSKEPARIIINFESEDVKGEFERIKGLGAEAVKEPYKMSMEGEVITDSDKDGMWIATLADPDGNYFQLMSPWKD
jgi:predicted enzyme related to lactoylglutathione lyase